MQKCMIFSIFPLILFLLLSACTQKVQEPPRSTSSSTDVVKPAVKAGWEGEWERTLDAARKEGKVVMYASVGNVVREEMVKNFSAKYGIRLEILFSGSGSQLSEKVIRERKGGLYLADVYQGGVTSPTIFLRPAGGFDSMDKAFILPDLKDPEEIKRVWWGGKLLWIDPDHQILAFMAMPQDWAVVNTESVKPEEMRSYRDLLNPKYKGKMVMFDPSMTGPGGKVLINVGKYIMGMDFMRELAKQEPIIVRDSRLMVEWVARGKNPIGIAPTPDSMAPFKQAGAPILSLRPPVEGAAVISGFGGLAMMNKAPNPNAAKIFINWLLSREGATIWSRAYGGQSARMDVPTDFLDPEMVRQPGVKFIWTETEDLLLKEAEMYPQAKEIFGIK